MTARSPVADGQGHPRIGRPIRVLILTSWYPSPENPLRGVFIREQAQELGRRADVALLHVDPRAPARVVTADRSAGFPVFRIGSPLAGLGGGPLSPLHTGYALTWGLARSARCCVDLLAAEGWGPPDVVHSHVLYPAAIAGHSLARRLRVPHVVTEHSSEFVRANGYFPRRRPSVQRMMRTAARHAFAVLPVSRVLEISMRECGLDARYRVVPNMVTGASEPVPLTQVAPRQIVHVSLLNDRAKNVSGLLRACAALRDGGEAPFTVRIVGDGVDQGALASLATGLGLSTHVVFDGLLDRRRTLDTIRRSAFLVTTSRFETFSMATAEALMCGRPVVSTRCGGPEEYVVPGVGLLVPPEDPAALEGALRTMLAKATQLDPRSIVAYARSRFSPSVVSAEILAVYRDALDAPRPRGAAARA
jgi:glycosyltransferase involved in cell wall biosynthesis